MDHLNTLGTIKAQDNGPQPPRYVELSHIAVPASL